MNFEHRESRPYKASSSVVGSAFDLVDTPEFSSVGEGPGTRNSPFATVVGLVESKSFRRRTDKFQEK